MALQVNTAFTHSLTAAKLQLLSMSGQTHRMHYVVTDRELCPKVQQQRQRQQIKTLQCRETLPRRRKSGNATHSMFSVWTVRKQEAKTFHVHPSRYIVESRT